ncbi:hypothetical protein D3C75_827790 [compost metagenome]
MQGRVQENVDIVLVKPVTGGLVVDQGGILSLQPYIQVGVVPEHTETRILEGPFSCLNGELPVDTPDGFIQITVDNGSIDRLAYSQFRPHVSGMGFRQNKRRLHQPRQNGRYQEHAHQPGKSLHQSISPLLLAKLVVRVSGNSKKYPIIRRTETGSRLRQAHK